MGEAIDGGEGGKEVEHIVDVFAAEFSWPSPPALPRYWLAMVM
jgi:hypothetical protein